jgi:hypothetical protein
MKSLYMIAYRYRDLDDEATKALTKRFVELGARPGQLAHYQRLDARGGFLVVEVPDDPEMDYERTMQLNEWIEFEIIPIATMEDAFPAILRNYG